MAVGRQTDGSRGHVCVWGVRARACVTGGDTHSTMVSERLADADSFYHYHITPNYPVAQLSLFLIFHYRIQSSASQDWIIMPIILSIRYRIVGLYFAARKIANSLHTVL